MRAFRWMVVAALIGVAWQLSACGSGAVSGSGGSSGSTGATAACGPGSCSGCCASDGSCVDGGGAGACGAAGQACTSCEADQFCSAGACQLIPGCIANDAACTNSADCCSAYCSSSGRCTAAPGGSSGGTTTGTTGSTGTSSGSTGSSGTTTGTTGTTGVTELTCAAPASYDTANGGTCGSFRWPVKTGTDPGASSVAMTPTVTTIGQLGAIPAPAGVNNGPDTRFLPTEGTLFMLKNVTLIETKLEPDSDYHLPVTDGTASMEVEIPYPGCVGPQSPWGCEITHARAALEKDVIPGGSYVQVNKTVTVIGVAFFDVLHGSASQAPNGIELHPVLALCFGTDCNPYAN